MTKAKTAKTPELDLGPLADELGALEGEMNTHQAAYAALHGPKLARIKQLSAVFRAECKVPAHVPWLVDGKKFQVILGICALERSIDYLKLVKAIGAAAYARFAKCTLGQLEKNVSPTLAAGVVSAERTGPRSLTTVARA